MTHVHDCHYNITVCKMCVRILIKPFRENLADCRWLKCAKGLFFIALFTLFAIWLPATTFANTLHSKEVTSAGESALGVLSLQNAIELASANDPWLKRSQFEQQASLARSVAAASLPDPSLSISLANLPTDGLAFNQEPMTQFKVGLSQTLARGDSLNIKREQLEAVAAQQPFLRLNRKASVAVQVSHFYLDAMLAKMSIALIEQDRALFEQLGDIAQSAYASAIGATRQQDVLRAELELIRIEDKLLALKANQANAMARLNEWLAPDMQNAEHVYELNQQSATDLRHAFYQSPPWILPEALPKVSVTTLASFLGHQRQHENLDNEAILALVSQRDQKPLLEFISSHPLVLGIEQNIVAQQNEVALAKEQYKPQWAVNASYAYRDDDEIGRSRADFLSIGLSVDLPLFHQNRQDQSYKAALNQAEASKTQKRLALRNMLAKIHASYANYERLLQRQALYRTRFIVQSEQEAEASLSAYTNDEGDFTEVVQARIGLLNAKLDALNIEFELNKTKMQLGYYFVQAASISHQQEFQP